MKTLVLFDIDGTLVLTGRAGLRALDRALLDVCGVTNALAEVAIGGRTDRAIITDALRGIGETYTTEIGEAVRERYCQYLADEVVADSPHPKLVLPGVAEALDALAPLEARGEVAVGLLTGNFARGAEIKLGYFDLWQRFRFGAFGDGHVDRRDLVPLALDAAERAGEGRFATQHVVIIGDTPADVDCAHAHGAAAIAVATGTYSVDDLRATGADVVVPDLRDWSSVWGAVYPRMPIQ
ncbi:MAG: haloacid dehalogenase-like hydrolase [Acidobacteria bacterium]|jgi:phosphoglycolate phosphatase-like HAD superfamily hydrolase|nr:haloacid dehalogenase-like hydrolase [Acidobacteriota bacterium]MBP8273549.1 haloacid dehalogenase-like hydrolase [Acidobacteriota bacterium]